MILSAIVAADDNDVIGLGNTLPWDMPADLRYFRKITSGHPCIMGRKTFDSIVAKLGQPLPNRRNIVITRQGDLNAGDIDQVSSLDDAIELAKGVVDEPNVLGEAGEEGEAFVIGGQQIFELAMPLLDRLYLTRIHGRFEGDRFMPHMAENEWTVVSEDLHEADDDNPYPYTFFIFDRAHDAA